MCTCADSELSYSQHLTQHRYLVVRYDLQYCGKSHDYEIVNVAENYGNTCKLSQFRFLLQSLLTGTYIAVAPF